MKIAATLILLLIATVTFAGDNAPWVDMKDCPICSNVSSEEGLMENMTWEHHLTATGVMTVSTIKPDYQEKFDRAKGRMKEIMGKVVAGEEIQVCGYCTSLSLLLKKGAKADNVTTQASDIMVVSSTDEATIAGIHTHAEKTIAFLGAAHAGHDH
ncbi:MAG: hypothetical protein OEV49_13860 [candidate division Zixibacteria bacterium]|nr:hypothetical protein [candidate division Zixibacteria bacterium]MDH3938599.1 hypothetical protein [candidate division Zixibacteria bacterium]MDH4033902.1 hypothetical protein [candidate division Zixibacteria bacterium]